MSSPVFLLRRLLAAGYHCAVPMQRIRKSALIDVERINEIGGLDNPDIVRILEAFVLDLKVHLLLIERLRLERCDVQMMETLHKLAGSARSCGFVGINRAIAAWETFANPYKSSLHSNLHSIVEASIEEWRTLVA